MRTNRLRNTWVIVILAVALLFRYGYEYVLTLLDIEYPIQDFLSNVSTWLISLFAVLIWVSIVMKSEYSVSKLPWLLLLIIEPFTGVFLFLTFGRDYRESRRFLSHPRVMNASYLTKEPITDFSNETLSHIDTEITDIYKTSFNMTHHHVYQNNTRVEILTDGVNFFPKLKEKLLSAQDFILLQSYIIRYDEIGKEILNILKQKSLDGVEVKFLYDSLGSYTIRDKTIKELKEAHIEVAEFDPIVFGFFDTRVNYRNHRKVIVIDGQVGFIGGMNIAEEYHHKIKSLPEFRDTHTYLKGSAVNSLTALFFRDWYQTTDQFIDDKEYYKAYPLKEEGLVQLIPSGPDFKYPPIRNIYVKMINNAKKSIKIMTPYLALDHETITSLIIAARGGVDVSIIVPGKPDKRLVYIVTQSYFQELLEEGIKIYTYNNKFTHAKILIMDDRFASVGTYNLDNRSARINFEATLLLYKQGVEHLVEDFTYDLTQSTEIVYNQWMKRGFIKQAIERVFALVMGPLV